MGEHISTDEALHLIVIGAGLAGLSAALSTKLANPAHRVTVLETVKELQEVGVRQSSLPFPLPPPNYPYSLRAIRNLNNNPPPEPASPSPPFSP